MPVVYLDVLLALNLFIDFLLLTATAAWRHLPHKRGRTVAGAAIGAAAACIVLLPAFSWWQQLLTDVAVAAVMCRVAFRWYGWSSFGKTVATLWGLSAGLGGICMVLWQVFSPVGFQIINGTVYYDIPPLTLILLTVLSYAALTLFERWARPRVRRQRLYRIRAEWRGILYAFTALYDSGNLLIEPFSGAPVIAVEEKAVEGWNEGGVPYRVIPYRTADREGVYPAFCPEKLTVTVGTDKPREISGVWLAVVPHLGSGEYRAAIGDAAIELLAEKGVDRK